VRFLVSAHAAHEELFLLRRLTDALVGPHGRQAMTMSWRYQPKHQPEGTKFKVPPVDAPNVNGARMFGLVGGNIGDEVLQPNLTALRDAVEGGRVSALYVFDPGPEGSMGDTTWIVDARRSGTLPLLVVQGVLLTPLARAADFVLPGASYVEKEASYTTENGLRQGASRAIAPPGEALEDWQILVNLCVAVGVPLDYADAAAVRADIANQLSGAPGIEGLTSLTFGRPASVRNWLQASNPSERWKWDFMFQDVPPVKGEVDPSSLPLPPGVIPLREVK
jgi:anaerobic selenocysteine-containing dehydrogenase